MITFKSKKDLAKIDPSDPLYPIIADLVDRLIVQFTKPGEQYNFQDYGFILKVESFDAPDRPIDEIFPGWYSLIQVPWEGVYREQNGNSRWLIGIMVFGEDGGYIFIFDDNEDLDPRLRQILEYHIDE